MPLEIGRFNLNWYRELHELTYFLATIERDNPSGETYVRLEPGWIVVEAGN